MNAHTVCTHYEQVDIRLQTAYPGGELITLYSIAAENQADRKSCKDSLFIITASFLYQSVISCNVNTAFAGLGLGVTKTAEHLI